MKYLLTAIIALHALIHLMGFSKAFKLVALKELSLPISKSFGLLWLFAFLLLVVVIFMVVNNSRSWWLWAVPAIVVSQFLIFYFWQDAKFGTITNIIIFLAGLIAFGDWNFQNSFTQDVGNSLKRSAGITTEILTEKDLTPLPEAVQKYLRYTGVVGKAKVKNFKVVMEGRMRSKSQDWFSFRAEQYNFFDQAERLFFMKARVKNLPASGYHSYKEGKAKMLIKLLSIFPVVDIQDESLFKAETVTIFNDRCILAPATLIDRDISWEVIDSNTVKAQYSNRGVTISAVLKFNETGQLIDFVSDDRMEVNESKTIRFSTPISNYKEINGYKLFSFGEAVWHYPEGAFTYGEFYLISVAYNVAGGD